MKRKSKAIIFILLMKLSLMTPPVGYSLDTDLYVLSGVNIPPNVLIILDNSASMDEVASGQFQTGFML